MGDLKNDLDVIYKNGYAVSSEELVEGMTSIAVPVFDFSESVIAAISLTGPNKDVNLPMIINELLTASDIISANLGYIKKSRKRE